MALRSKTEEEEKGERQKKKRKKRKETQDQENEIRNMFIALNHYYTYDPQFFPIIDSRYRANVG